MELISLILNFVLGSGLITIVVFYSSQKRKQAADASAAEVSVKRSKMELEHESIRFLQSQLNEAYTEIDKMQEIINRKRDEIIELIRQSKELEVNLINYQNRNRILQTLSCQAMECGSRCTSDVA